MTWAFGWSGGKQLVETSYARAKQEQAERKAAHKAKKDAEKAAADGTPDAGAERA